MTEPVTHPIEERSYGIMRSRVDFSAWSGGDRDVVERMVHATADETFAASALIGDGFVESAVSALRSAAAVVCDSHMVAAGIPVVARRLDVECYLDRVDRAVATGGETRSAAAMSLAARAHPEGSVWVIGNAPTALTRLLELHATGEVVPAAVIGLPVGYVGSAEAKAALWSSTLSHISATNRGMRGGSAVAAAALNAVARLVWA